MSRDALKYLLMKHIKFIKVQGEDFKEIALPNELLDLFLIAPRADTGLPVLRGITSAPAFVADGFLH